MANNVSISQGSGVDIATDDVAGAHYQLMKLAAGAEDSAARIGGDATNGLDTDVTRVIPGTGATNLGKAEDAAHVSGDTGVMLLAVRKDAAAALAGADGDYIPLVVDDNGRLHVVPPGNVNTQLLASAARTVTTDSPDQVNRNAKGVALLLDVTANPGGLETLTVSIAVKLGGVYRAITAFAATAAATNATYVYMLYPGIVETAAVGNVEVQGLVLPRDWRATVTPSAAGSWTYALESSLII